ncbi:BapA/Bap/LapF family large adhesin [Acinetobacter sp. WZC-1]|uniref:BapA/Bap/LapF family large adhesin n=1 Tax=Acinetobacter sp. WZC-1 TaxID=3459034 RepID=UPI00403E1890
MSQIQIIAKDSHQVLATTTNNSATLSEPSVVVVNVPVADVQEVVRDGSNAVIHLKNGEVITIENFFSDTGPVTNSLVFQDAAGKLQLAQFTDAQGAALDAISYQPIESINPLLYHEASSISPWAWAAIPLVAGGIAAAASHDSSSDKSPAQPPVDTTPPPAPSGVTISPDGTQVIGTAEPGSTVTVRDKDGNPIATSTVGADGNFTAPLDKPLTNGETVSVGVTDPAGHTSPAVTVTAPDSTAPAAPSDVTVSPDGTQVTGKGEPGSTVTVRDKDGNPIATVTVGADGNFTAPLDKPLTNGETVSVGVTDPAGHTSPAVTVTAPDTTAPAAPTDLAVSPDGTQVIGKGEPGSTVTVRDKDGNPIATATVGADGSFTAPLDKPLTNGEEVRAVLTDAAGNTSPETSATAQDTTAPAAPSDVTVSPDGTQVTGKGEPGSTVTVRDKDGNPIATATVGADGSFTAPLDKPLTNGETVSVGVTDPAGHTSPAVTVTAPDTTAPAAPSDVTVSPDGTQVTGKGEPGSTVTVRDKDGNPIATATVGADGNFTAPLDKSLTNGEQISVIQTDPANNVSSAVTVTAPDSTAPAAPSDVTVSPDGTQVTGKGEPGDTVTIRDKDGNPIATATVGADGNFTAPLDKPLTNGEQISAVQRDAANNTSPETTATAPVLTNPDSTPPPAPSDVAVSTDGTTVTGKGEPGAAVTISDKDGNPIGTATVGADGNFTALLEKPLTNGEQIRAVQTDNAGNSSPSVSALAPDSTAPAAPSDVSVSPDGTQVTGKGEPGSTVIVRDQDGNPIATATVGADGSFTAPLDKPLTNGEEIRAVQTDNAGNSSPSVSALAPDSTAPAAPSDVSVSPDGTQVTGKGEPGSTVIVRDQDGNPIATATVGADGSFTAPLDKPLTNGEQISVIQTDPANNVSSATTVTAPDITAPAAPTDVAVSPDGTQVTGKGVPGNTVTISDKDGNPIGTATVGADGSFALPLTTPLTNGEEVKALQTDIVGNNSPAVTATAPDSTAPAAPTDVAVSPDGTQVTGKGEPGATVTINDQNGNPIATATVAADGTFTAPLATPLTNGEHISAVQRDAANNTSPETTATAPVLTNPDSTPPPAPSDVSVSPDGTQVTGKGEPGAAVTISDKDGNPIGTATVGADGTFTAPLATPLTNGEQIRAVQTDTAGNSSPSVSALAPDSTAPAAPTDVTVSPDGTQVTGKGEPGDTVTIRDKDGNPIATATVAADGTFTAPLATPLTNGEEVRAVLTDAAGNTSPETSATAQDTTAPLTPSDVVISPDGSKVTGKGEPGAEVIISDQNGNPITTATVGADGTFSADLTTPLINGEHIGVVQKDAANNTSPEATATAPVLTNPDTTPPSALTDVAVSGDGSQVSGKGEPGNTVTITDKNGNAIGTAVVGADGSFTAPLATPLTNGEEVRAAQKDEAGNSSPSVSALAPDTTAPVAPTDVAVSADGTQVTGKGEPGSTVTISDHNGTPIATGTVGPDGTFSASLVPPLTNGEEVRTVLRDAAGNGSAETTATAPVLTNPDTTAPAAPTDVAVGGDGAQVTGKGEPGATVTVSDKDGNPIGTAVVGADGSFTAPLTTPLTNGEEVKVIQKDATGNSSPSVSALAPDTTAPEAPTDLAVSADGTQVTGKGEPGDTVTITDKDGNTLGSATVAADGTFTAPLATPLTNGEEVSAVQRDTANNTSPAATATAPDSTAPAAPTDLAVSADGVQVTGKGEPGSTVTVTDKDGNPIATATVAADGTFTAPLSTPLTNGEEIRAVQKDAANNTSPEATTNAPDTTAPAAPTDVAVSGDGTQVTGKGEPGAIVTINDQNGNPIATATVAADGTFTAPLTTPLTNGEHISAIQKDAANNTSPEATATAPVLTNPDTTAPPALTEVTVSGDGAQVTGKGEPGTTVTISDKNGNPIGTATVAADGTFTAALVTPLTNGEEVRAVQADTAGNSSPSVSALAPDSTAPAAPTDVAVSSDGTEVTGKGEPGSTVTVTDKDGNPIATATVAADGTFSAPLTTPLTNGEEVKVVQKDAANNTSAEATTNASDTTAPAALTDLAVSPDGTQVTGKGEPGATVTISDKDGNPIGTATVAAGGAFVTALATPLTNGEEVRAVQKDAANNTSSEATTNAPDTTAPAAPTDVAVSGDGTQVTGKGEPGATVTINDQNGNPIATATVAADGTFTAPLTTPLTNGEHISAVQQDAANNTSPEATATAPVLTNPDTTAPPALTEVAVSADGAQVTGKGEPGATVTISDKDGNPIATATVAADGSFTAALATPLTNGEEVRAVQTDTAGNSSPSVSALAPDTTAPAAPTDVAVSADGTQVTGKGEPGATVTISDKDGNPIATATVAADGTFSAPLSTPLTNGEEVKAVQKDAANNTSPEATTNAPDTTAPAAPTDLTVSADGTQVTGKGEPGTTVTLHDKNGNELGTATVGADGTFSVTPEAPLVNGEEVFAVLKDAANNESPEAVTTAPVLTNPDTTPPAALTEVAVSGDGTQVTGKGEPGATVTISDKDGNPIGTATVAADGSFTAPLATPLTNGEEIRAVQKDATGNSSPSVSALAPDTTAPTAPTDLAVSADGTQVTGKGEPGATVTVSDKDGNPIGTATADANGNFTVGLAFPLTNGEEVRAVQKDAANNTSPEATTNAPDSTAPAAPTDLAVSPDGTQVTGKGEPGDTVTISDKDGNPIGTATVAADGSFTVPLTTPLTNGEEVRAVQTDAANNTSPEATTKAPDTTPPAAPTDLAVSADGTQVTGKGEPGDTVTISDKDGNPIATATVAADGTFSAPLTTPLTNGEEVKAVQKDAANNTSAEATTNAPDSTAPAAPTDLAVSGDGTQVTGKGEPGATVTINDQNGNPIATATVAADGTFTAPLATPLTNGEQVRAVQTDAANNNSPETTATAPDTTAPAAPTDLAVSGDGTQVTGKGEPGATVTISDQNGNPIATATVAADGSFTAPLTTPLTNGEHISAVQKDAANNTSAEATATAPVLTNPDTTPPPALTDVAVSGDGTQVTGKGEPGATVTISDKNGNPIATATVAADGSFTAPLATPLTNGEEVRAVQTDAAGNGSPSVSALAPDTTAPAAPTDLVVSEDGTQVTGKGEPGSTVTVNDKDGNPIGTGTVGPDGTFTVGLTNPLSSGAEAQVALTDASGNKSPETIVHAPEKLVAHDDLAVLDAKVDPVESAVPGQSKTSAVYPSFVGLSLDTTWAANNALTVDVPQGTLENFKINISGLYTGLGTITLGLDILRMNENTGTFEIYKHISNAGQAVALAIGFYTGSTNITDLPQGKYAIVLSNGQGLNFTGLGFPTLTIPAGGVATDYGETVAKGNVIVPVAPGDVADVDPENQALTVTQVQSETGQTLAVNQSVTGFQKIDGAYGTLYIDKNGNYEYIRNPKDLHTIGKVDTFTYTIQDPDGHTSTANLNIHIDSSQVDITWPADPTQDGTVHLVAVNNSNDAQVDYTNRVETRAVDTGSMAASVTRTGSIFSGFTMNRAAGADTSDTITVDKNASAVLSIKITSTQGSTANGDSFGYIVQQFEGGVWKSVYTAPTKVYSYNILSGANVVIVDDTYTIPAAAASSQWRVVFSSTESNEIFLVNGTNSTTVQTSVQPVLTHNDQFTASGTFTAASGNLMTDDNGAGKDTIGGTGTRVFIENPQGVFVEATGQTLAYSTGGLKISADGSYTFTPNAGADGKTEAIFNYKLVAANGDESNVAILTMHLGQHFNTGTGNDFVTSTAGNDAYTTGAGADTVIFSLLNATNAAGGNGKDHWTDFKLAEGDKVDVTALLTSQTVNNANIGQFVTVTKVGADTVLSIDRDGSSGTTYNPTELLVLHNTDTMLDQLVQNHQLLF